MSLATYLRYGIGKVSVGVVYQVFDIDTRITTGDAIVIQCCMKHQRWVGALDGVTGVFNIDDTRIFQGKICQYANTWWFQPVFVYLSGFDSDIDGKLHEVKKTQLLVSEEDGK